MCTLIKWIQRKLEIKVQCAVRDRGEGCVVEAVWRLWITVR